MRDARGVPGLSGLSLNSIAGLESNATINTEASLMAARVEIDPTMMQGKPVIRGTRIPVEIILRKLAEGATTEDLLDAYPRLTLDDIRAALNYAADTIAHETVMAIKPD